MVSHYWQEMSILRNLMGDMPSPRIVFIADDDPDDHLLFQIALERSGVVFTIKLFSDGQELLDCLVEFMQHPEDREKTLPSLILLDMPVKDGFEVFEALRQNRLLREIPVVMFAGTALPDDIAQGYEMGIKLFVRKPQDLKGYVILLRNLEGQFR